MNNIVEPFTVLYGALLHQNHVAELTTPKRDLVKETYSQCTFKPTANSKTNDKIANRKYEKDFINNAEDFVKIKIMQNQIKNLPHIHPRSKSPVTSKNRLVVLYLDAKR